LGVRPKEKALFMSPLLAFLGVALIVIVTPGPDTAMTIRNTLFGGRAGGVATALGIAAGQTIWALATSIGVIAMLVASAPLFLAVKYAGAAYLFLLGLEALGQAISPSPAPSKTIASPAPAARVTPLAAFRQGVISNLGNPKMAVFFASLLPQFAPEACFAGLMLLGIVFAVMTFAWLALYAAVVARAGDVMHRPGIRRAIEGATGVLLVGLGLRIAAEQR
jgi:threonine/homoserine/homoserine lactone efflux protein